MSVHEEPLTLLAVPAPPGAVPAVEAALAAARLTVEGGPYVRILREEAREDARRVPAGAPLASFSVAVKDMIAVAGHPLSAGSAVHAGRRPEPADAVVVALLRRAGAVIVGIVTMHELAFGVTGLNAHHGTPDNPRLPGCVPGGSSSGSAVAVADGSARVALGTDTGGSCRIPAALCGVVGFKPGGRGYPLRGVLPLAPTLDRVGVLGRSVADVAAVHRVLGGAAPSAGQRPVLGVCEAELEAASPAVAAAVEGSLRALAEAGAELRPVKLPPVDEVLDVSTAIMFAEAATTHRRLLERRPELLGADVRARLEQGEAVPAVRYLLAQRRRSGLRRDVLRILRDVDAVVGPTVPVEPPTLDQAADPAASAALVANTRLANVVAAAALSIPIDGRRPVGLHVTASDDAAALRCGAWVEQTLSHTSMTVHSPVSDLSSNRLTHHSQ